MAESTDSGETWTFAPGAGWPAGGVSWFPFFVDTGDAGETRKTWFAIAQNGASAITTSDSGATWTKPTGLGGSTTRTAARIYTRPSHHLHRRSGAGPVGDGVYRSTDHGANWTSVADATSASCGARPRTSTRCGAGRARAARTNRPAAPDGPATGRHGRLDDVTHGAGRPRLGPEQRRPHVRRHARRVRRRDVGHGDLALRRAVAVSGSID